MTLQHWAGFPCGVSEQVCVVVELGPKATIQEPSMLCQGTLVGSWPAMMKSPGRGVAKGLDGPQHTGPQLQLWPQDVSSWKESMEVMSFLWTSTLLSVQ